MFTIVPDKFLYRIKASFKFSLLYLYIYIYRMDGITRGKITRSAIGGDNQICRTE